MRDGLGVDQKGLEASAVVETVPERCVSDGRCSRPGRMWSARGSVVMRRWVKDGSEMGEAASAEEDVEASEPQ